jgi:3'-phosphoadenosine 5'-phosphosulfate (PAPS) 3'-phosphatase
MMDEKPPADEGMGQNLQELVRAAAVEAGALAMRWFRPDERTNARVWTKGKSSPVTEADIAVDSFLRRRLMVADTEFGWLSEETADSPERLELVRFDRARRGRPPGRRRGACSGAANDA